MEDSVSTEIESNIEIERNDDIDSPESTESNNSAEKEEIADTDPKEPEEINYTELVENDIRELKSEFPELHALTDIYELKNPARYGALRDLGLSPREAYLASGGKRTLDNRAHLYSSVPKNATSPFSEIPRQEFEIAKEIFSDMSDSEIQKLYRKVNR